MAILVAEPASNFIVSEDSAPAKPCRIPVDLSNLIYRCDPRLLQVSRHYSPAREAVNTRHHSRSQNMLRSRVYVSVGTVVAPVIELLGSPARRISEPFRVLWRPGWLRLGDYTSFVLKIEECFKICG